MALYIIYTVWEYLGVPQFPYTPPRLTPSVLARDKSHGSLDVPFSGTRLGEETTRLAKCTPGCLGIQGEPQLTAVQSTR